jgi:drug/metabolite transporter (DMT)-like permease
MTPAHSMQRQRITAVIFMILAVLFWGFSFISTKIVLTEIPPSTIAFYRQFISVLTLLPLVWRSLHREHYASLKGMTWRDLGLIAASGFAGIVLYFVFENNGIRLSTPANTSMIVAAVPIFTLFSEALFFHLKITPRMLICVAFSIFGVYLVVSAGSGLDFSSARFRGNMLVVASMACWVGYTIINKKLTDRYSSLFLTWAQALVSIVLFLPFVAGEISRWRLPSLIPLLHLIYLGVCCSALGYIFYVFAVKRLGATTSSAFLNLIPVVTVVCSRLVLAEKISPPQLAGMLLVMASLYALIVPGRARRT